MFAQACLENRREAGRQLARRLVDRIEGDAVVVGLPRGGVEVAYEVAVALGAPLDVIVARKVGAPMQPEFAIGAVAPGGLTLLDRVSARMLGMTDDEMEAAAARERAEMERRLNKYRSGKDLPDLAGKAVILVDDGLATGLTALAAIEAARLAGAAKIVLAVPVCARQTAEELAGDVDLLICLEQPEPLLAIGAWYRDFSQTTDEEVVELLEEARSAVRRHEITES